MSFMKHNEPFSYSMRYNWCMTYKRLKVKNVFLVKFLPFEKKRKIKTRGIKVSHHIPKIGSTKHFEIATSK